MWRFSISRSRSVLSLQSLKRPSNCRCIDISDSHHHQHASRLFTSGALHYPEAPSKDQHHDVASYVAYAQRTGLDPESNVFIGTYYEYAVAAALHRLGFHLRRIGGQSDKGIDLLGTWNVPSTPEDLPLRVLLQCKAYAAAKSSRVGPQMIRELEGAYLGAPSGWRGSGVVGLLVAQRHATKGVREALSRSRWPLAYVCCSKDGNLEQMLWNSRAEDEGLEGMGVTASLSKNDRHGDSQRLVLTWKGRPYTSTCSAKELEGDECAEGSSAGATPEG
ncbi:hypothetical protein GGS20DRAFT_133050 [Poronia punctata]|nr:hypothetical protein GGS20DRAFT_133050 [Poronia punctata]